LRQDNDRPTTVESEMRARIESLQSEISRSNDERDRLGTVLEALVAQIELNVDAAGVRNTGTGIGEVIRLATAGAPGDARSESESATSTAEGV
jgi:hypothetical protein